MAISLIIKISGERASCAGDRHGRLDALKKKKAHESFFQKEGNEVFKGGLVAVDRRMRKGIGFMRVSRYTV